MPKGFFEQLFGRKKRKKKRHIPSPEVKHPQRRQSDVPAYPHNRSAFKRKRRKQWVRYAKRTVIGSIAGGVLLIGWFSYGLPDIDDLNKFTKTPSIIIKSEDGKIIGSFGDIYGEYVTYTDLPTSLVDAVVATEDRNFFHHFGIDPFGLLRATLANMKARHVVQGGSTITQQVAKNVFLTPERNLSRKIKEMLLALKLERRFSKEDIISIYLNRVYLGAGNYGVDAAAHRYFDKSARELTLTESAIIAGLLKAPSRFAPTSNPTLSRKRAEQVVINMQEAGYLTEQQSIRARDELVKAMNARKKTSQSSLYFADWIVDQLPEYIGNVQQDIVVTTTLRPEWQAQAEKAVTDIMEKEGEAHEASQAALVSMTPDGAVRALIGGRSYAESQYNRATQALRQPGSAFKLFVYLAGLEAGMTPDTMVNDQPISIKIVGGTWQPKNYTNKYLGSITLREALTHSVNTVAVQIAEQVGLDHVIGMARRMGITTDLEAVPSIALGATEVSLMELTSAYSHLPANGAIVNPYGIIEIDTAAGQPLYERRASGDSVVLRQDVVAQMNDMLTNVVENGTGRTARIGRPAAGKTGTTSDYRDAWFMGFTPDLVTGVWVGNDNNEPMKKVTGGMLPAQIWHQYMVAALASTPAKNINTDGHAPSALPWQSTPAQPLPEPVENETPAAADANGAPDVSQPVAVQDLPAPSPESPKAPPAPSDSGLNLGAQFWDKLMNHQ